MEIEENEISRLIRFFQEKHSKCEINFYYDEKNLAYHAQSLVEVMRNLDNLMDVFDECKKNVQIFMRIHFYKQWIIVRIKANIEQLGNVEKEIRKAFYGDLISIVYVREYLIIKLCYFTS